MFRFCSKAVPERGRRALRYRSGERPVALQELPAYAGYAMVIRYARMCAYMEQGRPNGLLCFFMDHGWCRFMHPLVSSVLFSSLFYLSLVPLRSTKKGKKIIFIFLITFGRVYSFSLSAVFVFFGFAFLFTVACSVELRSYGGLARRGTLSTFVPIQFAAPVSILSKIHARPDALNADVTIGCYLL